MQSDLPKGVVWLVGAGPGDPGLLTLRGRDLLAQADVVLADRLANPLLLRHAPQARLIDVGKTPERHPIPQAEINAILIAEARAGHRVVRLKGGDPFIFGRGGEECAALAEAGIRFEVVPGITSGIAAGAYAGIPLTHRDFNSGVTFVTGHDSGAASEPTSHDWGALARMKCLVFYMGAKTIRENLQRLMDEGLSPETPAASIQWGTTARQRTLVATVATLADDIAAHGFESPIITIVGSVVDLHRQLNWFETRPLFGQRIVVTRPGLQSSNLVEPLAQLGANVIEAPMIRLHDLSDYAQVDAAIGNAHAYDWIIFSSAHGVTTVRQRLQAAGLDVRCFGQARIAVVGRSTADAVASQLLLRIDRSPRTFHSEALLQQLQEENEIAGKRFLLLRGRQSLELLPAGLLAIGADVVDDVPLYDTRSVRVLPDALVEMLPGAHWIIFTSASTAQSFAGLMAASGQSLAADTRIASIGPVTSAALRELNMPPTVEANPHTFAGIIDAIHNAR